METDFNSLQKNRKDTVDSRYREIERLLSKNEIRVAYTLYSELFQTVFRLSGTLFGVNEFTINYTRQLHKLLKQFQSSIDGQKEYTDIFLNLLLLEIFIRYIELLYEDKSEKNYNTFVQELEELKELLQSYNEDLSEDNISEYELYILFLDLASIMIYTDLFGAKYYSKMQHLVDKVVGFIASDPEIIDPMAFSNLSYNMAGVLLESDLEMGKEVMNFALQLTQTHNAQAMYTRAYTMLGHYYRLNGDLDQALETYQKAVQTDRVPLIMYNYAVRHIGHIYQTRGELDLALKYYQKSLDLFEFVENHLGVARTLQYIGNIHYLQAEFPVALEYYGKSLNLLKMRNYPRMIVDLLYSHIRVYLELKDIEKSKELLTEMEETIEDLNHKGMSQVYKLSQALILKNQHRRVKKAQAQQLLEELLEEGQVNHEYTVVTMQELCELLIDEMRSEYAEEIFQEANILVDRLYDLGKEQQLYQVQIQALILQSQFDMIQGNFEQTLEKLTQAEQMGREKDLPQLTQYVRFFKNQYEAEFNKWQVIISETESLEDRLANEEIQEYIKITLSTVQEEKHQTEVLLKNVLPEEIIPHLQNKKEIYAEKFENVSILFADIVGFTGLSEHLDPHEMVLMLNEIFSNFDQFLNEYDVEKIRTIGDNYMVVVGAPRPHEQPSRQLARFALKISQYLKENQSKLSGITFRMGMNSGSVIAAVVGTDKYNFDVWGDAVNIAARMESHGVPGKIQVTEKIYHELKDEFDFEERGLIEVKGKGSMKTYFLNGKKIMNG